MKNNSKRILFVNHTSVPGGGASDDYVRLLKHLNEGEKFEVTGVFPEGHRAPEFAKYCDKVYYYTGGIFPVIPGAIYYYHFFRSFIKQIKEFNQILKQKKFDLAIINVVVLLVPALMIHRKKINSIIIIREEVKPFLLRWILYKIINRITSNIITVAQYLSDDYKRITGNNNILVLFSAIENKITINFEQFESYLKMFNIQKLLDKNIKIVTLVGSISVRKNQMLLLKTMLILRKLNKLEEYRFVFIGEIDDPRYFKKLQQYIHTNSISEFCFFLGDSEKNIVYNFLLISFALVICSFSEGFPLVIPEAFKFNTPVISTKVGGISDIITENVNGLFIEFSSTDLANKILKLNDEDFRKQIVNNANLSFIKNFNLEENLKKFDNFVANSI